MSRPLPAITAARWPGLVLSAAAILILSAMPARFATPVLAQEDGGASRILERIDDLYRGTSSHAKAEMTVKTANYTRSMRMEVWSKGEEKTLIRILEPKRERNTATLKVGSDLWNYLPKIDRVIKLPASRMSGNWMGSHFTNDDLVKESRFSEDYTCEIVGEETVDGAATDKLRCEPKPGAVVVWGTVELWVRQEDTIPVREVYYDEDGEKARTMYFREIEMMAGRERPTVMRMEPADKPGEYTQFHYMSLELDVDIRDSFFSLRTLKNF